ncbi:MAG: hypothetical protein KF861_04780 [Planctomycetaceae bacterium]|nr:hypothetical protein [Planctomycetaceae bacterium]
MHWLGKVLPWVIGVLALVAWVLTSMLYDAQGAWQQRVEERLAKRDQLAEQLRQKSLAVANLEADVNRTMMPWGRAWELGPQQVQLLDAATGKILLGIGPTNAEFALRESSQGRQLPEVFLFEKNADGTSKYMGAFRVTAVEPDRVTAQLIRQPFPGEAEQWQAADGVRVWESIPSDWRALHSELQAQLAIAQHQVIDHEARLAIQRKMVAESQKQLERRVAQLQGNANPIEGAGQDTLDGLVLALRKEETTRNEQLFVLNQLRHEFNSKYNLLMELLEQNRVLAGQLPEAESDEPSRPAVGDRQSPLLQR